MFDANLHISEGGIVDILLEDFIVYPIVSTSNEPRSIVIVFQMEVPMTKFLCTRSYEEAFFQPSWLETFQLEAKEGQYHP